jgi:mRNA interferase MazF
VKRGEIWWVELPEQKRRPYLVLSRDAVIGVLNRMIAVPLTTTIRRIPTEVFFGPDDGLPRECVAAMDNIENVPKWAFIERMGTVPLVRMNEICRALNVAVDC